MPQRREVASHIRSLRRTRRVAEILVAVAAVPEFGAAVHRVGRLHPPGIYKAPVVFGRILSRFGKVAVAHIAVVRDRPAKKAGGGACTTLLFTWDSVVPS